jgi:tRNA(Ile)-lysidine synthase TilS/MesJ
LFFTLIPILALLSNYDQENCLINVGTEGEGSGYVVLLSGGLDSSALAFCFARADLTIKALTINYIDYGQRHSKEQNADSLNGIC